MRFWRLCFIFLLGLVPTALGWGFLIEPDLLQVRRWVAGSPTWPASMPGLRILMIADPHMGAPHIDAAKLERVVELANREKPDLIVLMGDYIAGGLFTSFVPPENSAAIFKKLEAPLGVYTLLGNHDWWFDGERVARAFEAVGIPVLENRAIALQWQGETFWLAGMGDRFTKHNKLDATLSHVPLGAPVILAMHDPDDFPEVPRHVGLTLAAHTHGGQVKLPLLGRLVVPSRYGQRFAYGLVDEGKGPLVVSGGIGTSIIPVRFGIIPEITLVTLKAS